MSATPFPIRSLPGIQRDGTRFSAKAYVDGLWCRFQRNLPKKMGGYITLTDTLPERVYGLDSYSQAGVTYHHLGSTTYLTQVRMNSAGNFLGLSDRTPGGSFNPNVNNVWQFSILADPLGGNARVIAHPGQNLSDIDSTTETDIYVGDVSAATALTTTAMDPVSGGIVVLYPYLLAFSNAGRVDVSDLEDLSVPPVDSAFVTGSKIVRGMSLRGGGGGPAGLLWSLDSLIRATFNSANPADGIFAYDTIADDISILSSRGVVADMGIYYWVGVDRFFMFNGVVREIPNDYNSNFFFNNLNFTHRQKVFAMKVPRFGEIWWCFPRGSATECNWAVVYNRVGNFWYDTPLPGSGRTDGLFPKVYNRPFMTGNDLVGGSTYRFWQHETGTDEISGSSVQPIRSYFETAPISLATMPDKPSNLSLRVERVEPDFVQTGDMTLTVVGSSNARASDIETVTKTFPVGPTTPEQQTVPFKDGVRRLMRFRFESNTSGGDYEMGECLGHIEPNDGRVTQ
jgi:hypothetical protein